MEKFKLSIDLLPKGAWGNDFSKTLPKKDWDILREKCYERANHKCAICGYETDELDAHEVWDFNINTKTQTLLDIIPLCSKCHGVKHMRNSIRLGFGEDAKQHFMQVNKCSELDFATHLTKAQMDYEERNKVYRWKIKADLERFGGKGIEVKQTNIPLINNPYENVEWSKLAYKETKELFEILRNEHIIGAPKIVSIVVDNYQGTVQIKSLFSDRIEWYLNNKKIKTKYNVAGLFDTVFKVKDLSGGHLKFKLIGIGGQTISKIFELLPQEVL